MKSVDHALLPINVQPGVDKFLGLLLGHVINTPYWDIRAQFPDLMVYGEERTNRAQSKIRARTKNACGARSGDARNPCTKKNKKNNHQPGTRGARSTHGQSTSGARCTRGQSTNQARAGREERADKARSTFCVSRAASPGQRVPFGVSYTDSLTAQLHCALSGRGRERGEARGPHGLREGGAGTGCGKEGDGR